MSQKKRQSGGDPVVRFIEGFFGGLWSLIQSLTGWGKNAGLEKAKAEFQRHWQAIEAIGTNGESAKQAIFQADILLDKALQYHKIPGNTLGDRLKAARNRLNEDTLNKAWSAHKVRNRLAHELQYRLTDREAQQALTDFRQVLKAMHLL